MSEPIPTGAAPVVPANEASWDDLAAIFGTTDYPGRRQCQRFKLLGWVAVEPRTAYPKLRTSEL